MASLPKLLAVASFYNENSGMNRFLFLLTLVFTAFGQIQKQDPNELLRQAIAFQQAGQWKDAIGKYRLFLNMYPNMPEIRSNLGSALSASGNYEEAIGEYRRALDLQPDPNVRLNLGLAYYKASRLPEAIAELKTVRSAMPSNLQAVLLLADAYLSTGENAQVVDLLDPLWKNGDPDLGLAYLLGTALVREGKTAEGQLVVNKIFAKGDSAEALLLMGTTKLASKDFAAATGDLKRAVEMNPKLPEVHSYYGIALLAAGDSDQAKEAFVEELRHNPNSFESNMRLGVISRQEENFDEAMKYLKSAQRLRPGNVAVRYQVASVNLEQGRIDEARSALESVVAESPSFTEAHVKLATVYYRQKRKADGDRERALVEKLNAAKQAKEPAVAAQ